MFTAYLDINPISTLTQRHCHDPSRYLQLSHCIPGTQDKNHNSQCRTPSAAHEPPTTYPPFSPPASSPSPSPPPPPPASSNTPTSQGTGRKSQSCTRSSPDYTHYSPKPLRAEKRSRAFPAVSEMVAGCRSRGSRGSRRRRDVGRRDCQQRCLRVVPETGCEL